MDDMTKTVSKFYSAVEKVSEKKRKGGYDTRATVTRVEDGIAWVHIPDGVSETPARLTINAKVGDVVQVRIANGQAFLIGNASAPPTDNTEAIIALNHANEAAQAALIAHQRADEATADAERAHAAADSAQASADAAKASADDAAEAASDAQSAAETAQRDASTANEAANNALTQLATVEDVVGVLNWISEHGTYKTTTDTAVQTGKLYFTRTGTGTEADPYVYTVIQSPSGDPSAQGWYELDSVDEAVSNYVSAHISLTDAGLWILLDGSAYKLLITSNSVDIYDPNGAVIASYGQETTIGNPLHAHQVITSESTNFMDGDDTIAYLAQDKFYATNAEVENAFYIGQYSLRYASDGKFVIGLRR